MVHWDHTRIKKNKSSHKFAGSYANNRKVKLKVIKKSLDCPLRAGKLEICVQ